MAARDWFRALQVPVLPVSAGPVIAGSLFGAASNGGHLDALVMALVLASVLAIQVAANIQKGLIESGDLAAAPATPRSTFVFDAGAVRRLGLEERALKRLTIGAFGLGAALGLAVVAVRMDLILLVLGLGGFVAAYSYSGAPFKLSYRGAGEVSTFLAFGPLMFIGAFYAQDPAFYANTILLGSLFGFFAAAISFARYFPPAAEDALKGKRTPVVRMGARPAGLVLDALLLGAVFLMLFVAARFPWNPPWSPMDPNLLATFLIALTSGFVVKQLRSTDPRKVEGGVRTTVLLHYGFSVYMAALGFIGLAGAPS
jgi:1,4-dihydroxy-2-naphthoate octaprenyltransferase